MDIDLLGDDFTAEPSLQSPDTPDHLSAPFDDLLLEDHGNNIGDGDEAEEQPALEVVATACTQSLEDFGEFTQGQHTDSPSWKPWAMATDEVDNDGTKRKFSRSVEPLDLGTPPTIATSTAAAASESLLPHTPLDVIPPPPLPSSANNVLSVQHTPPLEPGVNPPLSHYDIESLPENAHDAAANQILGWLALSRPSRCTLADDPIGAAINQAWESALGLMEDGECHATAKISATATRLCGIINDPIGLLNLERSPTAGMPTFDTDIALDVFIDRASEPSASSTSDCEKQQQKQHHQLTDEHDKSIIERLTALLWPYSALIPSNVASNDAADEDSDDLVQAYLRLAEMSNSSLTEDTVDA